MLEKVHDSWQPILSELYKEPLVTLKNKVLPEVSWQPAPNNVFKVFEEPLKDIKVIILGQDPFPGNRESNGLAFLKEEGFNKSKSMLCIEEEFKSSLGIDVIHPETWSKQGIFLLNTALTVETGLSGSHTMYWKSFTERVVQYISSKNPCIWLLWGLNAHSFRHYICNPFYIDKYDRDLMQDVPVYVDKNYIQTSVYPSFKEFSGCDHFWKTNKLLEKNKKGIINW